MSIKNAKVNTAESFMELEPITRKRKARLLDYEDVIMKKKSRMDAASTFSNVAAAILFSNSTRMSQVAAASAPSLFTDAYIVSGPSANILKHLRAEDKEETWAEDSMKRQKTNTLISRECKSSSSTSSSTPPTPSLSRSSLTITTTRSSRTPSTRLRITSRAKKSANWPSSSSSSTHTSTSSAASSSGIKQQRSEEKHIIVQETNTRTIVVINTGCKKHKDHQRKQQQRKLSNSGGDKQQKLLSGCRQAESTVNVSGDNAIRFSKESGKNDYDDGSSNARASNDGNLGDTSESISKIEQGSEPNDNQVNNATTRNAARTYPVRMANNDRQPIELAKQPQSQRRVHERTEGVQFTQFVRSELSDEEGEAWLHEGIGHDTDNEDSEDSEVMPESQVDKGWEDTHGAQFVEAEEDKRLCKRVKESLTASTWVEHKEYQEEEEVEYELDIRAPQKRDNYPAPDSLSRVGGIGCPDSFRLKTLSRLVASTSDKILADIYAQDARLVDKNWAEMQLDPHHPWAQGPIELITSNYHRRPSINNDYRGYNTKCQNIYSQQGDNNGTGHHKNRAHSVKAPALSFQYIGNKDRQIYTDGTERNDDHPGSPSSSHPEQLKLAPTFTHIHGGDNNGFFFGSRNDDNKENEWYDGTNFDKLITPQLHQLSDRTSSLRRHILSDNTDIYATEENNKQRPSYAAPSFFFPSRQRPAPIPLIFINNGRNRDMTVGAL
ncbi:hypothetical protein BGW39_000924 [Mortierella sp. 14UC]|nr:hypothetical protein BGW39_000924 [Mortierella sp. 14UC]